jgi:hypothetical protein
MSHQPQFIPCTFNLTRLYFPPPTFSTRLSTDRAVTMTNVLADQTGSLLLSKLPVELRCLIWEYAIGRQHLHIIRKKAKFRHISCHPKIWKLNGSATPFSPSVPFLNGFTTSHMQPWSVCTSPYSLSADDQLATWSMLSLLCTCQQMYVSNYYVIYLQANPA